MSENRFIVGALADWLKFVDRTPEPGYLIKDLVMGASLQLVTGPATRGRKTWWALAQSLAIASGQSIGGLEPVNKDGLPVMMLELEGGMHAIARRFRMLANSYGVDLDSAKMRKHFHWYHWATNPKSTKFSLKVQEDIKWLNDYIDAQGVSFVTIDTFAQAFLGDENNTAAMNIAMQILGGLYAAGPTIQILHHTRKDTGRPNEDIDDAIRGSSTLAGAYRVHHAFRTIEGDAQAMRFVFRSNDAEEQAFRVEWRISGEQQKAELYMTKWGDDETVAPDEATGKALLSMLTPGVIVTSKVLSQMWAGYSINALLKQFIITGELQSVGHGKWMRTKETK